MKTPLPSCELEYIYEPISPYRRSLLDLAHRFVSEKARVLDLCNVGTAFYWAMSYLEKADRICFAERRQDILDLLSTRVDTLSPECLIQNFSDLISEPQNWLQELHEKIEDLSIMDPWSGRGNHQKYDAIFCVEPFGSANSEPELEQLVSFCTDHLAPGGRIIGCVLHYDVWNESLESLSQEKSIGRLNPDKNMLCISLAKKGLDVIHLEKSGTGIKNHSQAIFFCAELPLIS